MRKGEVFGPPYAVFDLSRVGLRYFRFFLRVRPEVRDSLVEQLKSHPGVGWIFLAEGWGNLGVGILATNNAEIVEVSAAIRKLLGIGDVIVYQSELTSLYGFAKRPYEEDGQALPILDAAHAPVELSPLELDYIKIVAMDNSLPAARLAELLGITIDELQIVADTLANKKVIVGSQERISHTGLHHKVFVDTLSATHDRSVNDLISRLWHDQACIYIERAVAKYDLEFEVILPSGRDIGDYLTGFGEYQSAVLTENLYTNLYPLNKVANFTEIQSAFDRQKGSVVDLRNSKLWYLNYRGADAYLNIYENKEYFEVMGKGELTLFPDVARYIRETTEPGSNYAVLDIGSGNGMKGRALIELLGEHSIKSYYPIDIQPIELAVALQVHEKGAYAKHPTLLSFENLHTRFPLQLLPNERQISMFLGGTYGNFPSRVINGHVKRVLSPSSVLIIAMPIVAEVQTSEQIVSSYANMQAENMAFGPLSQYGFAKDMFVDSPQSSGLKVHIDIEDDRLITSFVLNSDVTIANRTFSAGTIFKVTTSWKPTLEQFKEALEADFCIERMFHNEQMAIAIVRGK